MAAYFSLEIQMYYNTAAFRVGDTNLIKMAIV